MVDVKTAFGHYKPDEKTMARIQWCRNLPPNWFGKQLAQWQRKKIMRTTDSPLDLSLDGICFRSCLTGNVSERNFVFMPWRFDVFERELMLKLLPTDGVFVDIGANVGIYSLLVARQLKQSGVVLAFEPNPEVYERLVFNLKATLADKANPPRVELLALAVSDDSGQADLYLDAGNLGASSLRDKPGSEKISVQKQALLSVINAQKLSRIHVLKCDVEGAEDRALVPFFSDAPNHLLPDCVIVEDNSEQWEAPLFEVIQQRGYQQSHHTRLNAVFQKRQQIRLSERVKAKTAKTTLAGVSYRESSQKVVNR